MESWHRYFAYITGSLVIGLLIILFTNSFFAYVNNPGWIGYVALTGYGLIFINICYVLARRFTKKLEYASPVSYLMATLVILPTLLWIYTKETPLGESRTIFTLTLLIAAYLGTFYGIRAGSRKRVDYLEELREKNEGELPDDLRRPHDDMSRN